MVTQAPSRARVLAALLFTLTCVSLIVFVWTQFGGTIPFAPHGYQLHVRLREASQLVPGNDVRISGVKVGTVTAVRRAGELSDATLELQPHYAPRPGDTRAMLRLKTLLGESYVELSPGTPSAVPLSDGGTIAAAHVDPTQPLDRVLSLLDAPTRARLDTLLDGTSIALSDHGGRLNDALGNLGVTTGQLDALARILDSQRAPLGTLVRDTGVVLHAAARRRSDLQSFVSAGGDVLATTARRNRELTATVRALDPLVPALRHTLVRVHHTLDLADPSLRELRGVAPLVAPTLAQLIRLGPPARALLHQALPLIFVAHRALPALTRITSRSIPLFNTILPLGEQIAPMIELAQRYAPELQATMGNLAAATRAGSMTPDGFKNYVRGQPVLGSESLFGWTQRVASNRHNAYHAPGELARVGQAGIRASDCRNVGNPTPTTGQGPPCVVQPGFSFQGLTQYFPHVLPAKP